MAKFKLEEVLKQHTSEDGVVDTKAVMKLVDQEYVNPIVTKNKVDVDRLKEQHRQELLKEVGFENIEDVTKLKQLNDEGKYADLELKLQEATDQLTLSQKEITKINRNKLLTEAGALDVDYVSYKLSGKVTDEIDEATALQQLKEELPNYFEQPKKPVSGKPINKTTQNGSKANWEVLLEERTGVKLK